MSDKPFNQAIDLPAGFGSSGKVDSVSGALSLLMGAWPAERGERHRTAVETLLKVQDGHRSIADGEMAFQAALDEAVGS